MLSELLQNETKEDKNGERGIDMLKIIYEDHDILVAEKPAGLESQASRGFEPDMVSEIKNHLKRAELSRLSTKPSTKSSTRPVEPYVGVIHRLDKPVGGIMVYAKNQKAAASLSKQVQDGRMKKIYNAVVCGKLVDIVGNYVDYLLKDGRNNFSFVVDKDTPDSRRAELVYRALDVKTEEEREISLVEIELLSGRHHQIRVQFAAHGNPLWGDGKYNPEWGGTLPAGERTHADRHTGAKQGSGHAAKVQSSRGRRGERELALAAVKLSFVHPSTGKNMEFAIKPRGRIFERFGD